MLVGAQNKSWCQTKSPQSSQTALYQGRDLGWATEMVSLHPRFPKAQSAPSVCNSTFGPTITSVSAGCSTKLSRRWKTRSQRPSSWAPEWPGSFSSVKGSLKSTWTPPHLCWSRVGADHPGGLVFSAAVARRPIRLDTNMDRANYRYLKKTWPSELRTSEWMNGFLPTRLTRQSGY